jgi:hypothetical protein
MAENHSMAYVYSFKKKIKDEEIEYLILWALKNAEIYYGNARVRLEFSYLIKDSKCIIRGGSEVSDYIARIFTGLLIQRLGEENFKVEQVTKKEVPDKKQV